MLTNQQCLDQFLLVSRCWQDHELSKAEQMGFEKAVKLLDEASLWTSSGLLRKRVQALMEEIIYNQEEPEYLREPIKI